uniref:Uncharacterized protein n=1 Tax=Globisporangium ultimum (strain ATCC 200006 / CBS 805.95 / DAOM BR144) TaxID=431595 RepID=K3X575_GLOUD
MLAGRAARSGGSGSSARHAVLSLATTFRLPHEGMSDMEYLSRGSAFLLTPPRPTSAPSPLPVAKGHELAVLTCQHVACPWLFPKYFADKWDWLQHVSEEFVQHTLQLLELPPVQVTSSEPSQEQQQLFIPKVIQEIPLQRHVWLHPRRDMAMLSLGDAVADTDWDQFASDWNLELLTLQPAASKPGDVVLFTGHKQIPDDVLTTNEIGQYPKEVVGQFVGQNQQGQAFAWSDEILEEGMCGGAVVNADGDCVGLIEGIVPPFVAVDTSGLSADEEKAVQSAEEMRKALENHVAFIPSAEIDAFVATKGDFLPTGTLLDLDDDNEDDLW